MINPKYVLEIDWNAPVETNLEFLEKCLTDIKNKKRYLKQLNKLHQKITPDKQIDLETAIHEETNNKFRDQNDLPFREHDNLL